MSDKRTTEKSIAQKFTTVARTLESCTPDERTRLLKMLSDAYVLTPKAPEAAAG